MSRALTNNEWLEAVAEPSLRCRQGTASAVPKTGLEESAPHCRRPKRSACAQRQSLASRRRSGLVSVPRQTAGVTLLELLVVVALASILLAVVFPSVGSGLTTLELRTSAQRLAAAARYARDQAVYRQTAFHLEIDSEAGRVAVMDLQGRARRAFELPASVRVESILPPEEETTSKVRRFLFMPDGAAPAFEVVLANQRREMRVMGDPLTGAAKVSEESGE